MVVAPRVRSGIAFLRLLVVVVVVCSVVCDAGAPPRSNELTESYTFDDFVADFGRAYDADEVELRRSIFEENLAIILEHNRRYYAAENIEDRRPTYTMGVNDNTDKRRDELLLGYVRGPRRVALDLADATATNVTTAAARRRLGVSELPFTNAPASELPARVDWREKGVVTPVKQQECGSCWAFAAAEAIESRVALATGELVELSTAELVDCVRNPQHCGGPGGCEGATSELAFDYARAHGLSPASSRRQTCPATSSLRAADGDHDAEGTSTIDGYALVPSNDYLSVLNAVARAGPVTASIDASDLTHYESGVFDSHGTTINHAVVLVGYGTTTNGTDYWLVRNSWGERFGENGYVRLKREENPPCGTDSNPEVGVACTLDDNGDPINPPQAKVCGACGILYDVVVPLGGARAKPLPREPTSFVEERT